MALVAERTEPGTRERQIIAVGRINKLHARNEAEVAVLVADQYQKLAWEVNCSAAWSDRPR